MHWSRWNWGKAWRCTVGFGQKSGCQLSENKLDTPDSTVIADFQTIMITFKNWNTIFQIQCLKMNVSKSQFCKCAFRIKIQNFSFDPESNGDTNAPNGIDPAFFQDQVETFFRLTQILLKSWHSLKGSAQDGSQHLIFGGGRIWMTELDPQTGVSVIAKLFPFCQKNVLRETQRAELKSENAGSLTTHHMIILWSLSQILSRAPEMLKLPFRFPDWGQLVGVERPRLPFPCESKPVFFVSDSSWF